MPRPTKILTGQRFGRLIVGERVPPYNEVNVLCECDCGNTKVIRQGSLTRGYTKSCGCYNKEARSTRKTHGQSHIPEHMIWHNMVRRVGESNRKPYTIDPRWIESYENFVEDVGKRPSKSHRLTRRVLELGFTKENCYWRPAQNAGKRKGYL